MSPFSRSGIATAAALALTAAVGPAALPAAAAGPNRSPAASALLKQLADRAAARPPLHRTGRYDYISTRDKGVEETETRAGKPVIKVDFGRTEVWVAHDGSGRIRDTADGRTSSHVFKAGELSPPVSYPTDPAALQKVLAKSHPAYGTYEWFVAVHDVWLSQVVGRKLESALLLMLVNKPNMRDRGMVTDPVGRRGIEISSDTFHNGHVRLWLIFDPKTGQLLADGSTALSKTNRPLTGPTATTWDVWVTQGYTKNVTSTP